jgi:putative hydrolase of the HAD superfamily
MTAHDTRFQGVIFDLGGVVLASPLPAIAAFEAETGLPPRFVGRLVIEGGRDSPWECLERGELDAQAFCVAFEQQAVGAGYRLDGAELLHRIGKAVVIREEMLTAIRRLRDAGLRVAALTNAWAAPDRAGRVARLGGQFFDCFVESFRVGMRKPERRIYELVCRELNVPAAAAVFLDDFGTNLKPARALGMTTIKVGDPTQAITELEHLTGISLQDR